jgi:hypothetical protein
MKNKISIISILLLVAPTVAGAASFSLAGANFKGVIDEILSYISILVPILYSLCFIAFFWGLSKFILNSGSAQEVQKGKNYMIWGITALFILVSLRVIIGILARELEIGDSKSIPIIKTTTNTSGTDSSTFSLPAGIP